MASSPTNGQNNSENRGGYRIYCPYVAYTPSETDNERRTRLIEERSKIIVISSFAIGIVFFIGFLVSKSHK